MHSSRRLTTALAACALATGLIVSGPAGGAILETGSEQFEFTETVNKFCDVNGLRVQVDGEGTVRYRLDTRGSKGYVLYAEHAVVDVRFTNTRTGAFVTSHETTMFKDLRITDNGDGTHTVIYFGTGNAVLYDSSGTAIGRNPGQTRWEAIIDLNGTPQDFDDDEFISEEVILGSTGRNDDFCTVVVPELT